MTSKNITIDGNRFSNEEEFYIEIDNILTKNLTWKTGHNLNAFNDLLCGGFGVFGSDELVTIVWKNIAKSKVELGKKLSEDILSIISEHKHITLIIE